MIAHVPEKLINTLEIKIILLQLDFKKIIYELFFLFMKPIKAYASVQYLRLSKKNRVIIL